MTEYDLEHLKCDKMQENIHIAKEYFKTNSEIRGLGPAIDIGCHVNEYVLDQCGNKIFLTYWEKLNTSYHPEHLNGENLSIILRKLVMKVVENERLFSQMDFMMRNYPTAESKSCHIQLIVHQLSYWSSLLMRHWASSNFKLFGCGVLVMNDSIPLFNLGCVANMLAQCEHVVIQTTKETAAICYLFTQLCHEVGLDNYLTLACVEEQQHTDNLMYLDYNEVEGVGSGCTGVVMTKSDLDSAVDTFVASSVQSPWKLRRILIQESVFDSFKKTLEWKCRMNNTQSENEANIGACADVFACGGKVFVVGGGGGEPLEEPTASCLTVQMEAFRTIKELISLIGEDEPVYLSVWASNIFEANEIASELDVAHVWLNQYGNFAGPPNVCQGIYPKICQHFSRVYVHEDFGPAVDKWAKLDQPQRRAAIFDVVNVAAHSEAKPAARRVREAVLRADQNTFAELEPGAMCVGVDKPIGVVAVLKGDEAYLHSAINSAMNGNGLVYSEDVVTADDGTVELLNMFQKANVPIACCSLNPEDGYKVEIKVADTWHFYQTKVIWTIYKTLFVN